MTDAQNYFKQVDAAHYLGISPRYFREHVDVEPVPFPGSGDKKLAMYRRADLDAWAEQWARKKSA
jgi:hypothetical protein